MKATFLTLLLISGALAGSDPAPFPVSNSSGAAPARFLSETLDDRIAEMKRRLSITGRERGPFGLYQNPERTPVVTRAAKEVAKTSFRDFIKDIRISLINSRAKEFLVGARLFRLGQVFPIVREGQRISVRVEAVSSSSVTFRNLQSGELAVRRLNDLPEGVTTAGRLLRVPGITNLKKSEAEPLRIESNSSPPLP